MVTTVTPENVVSIPSEIVQHLGIQPGSRLNWEAVEGTGEVRVRVISRGELARQLLGAGKKYSPERDAVAELIAEREREDQE